MPSTTPQAFERQIKIATAGLNNDQIRIKLARVAREAVHTAVRANEFPPTYITNVNGRIGVSEESVVPPGPIIYTARWWPEVLTYAVSFATERSPVKSGRFKNSWFVMSNGAVTTDYAAIPITAEVILTNDQPYARKIEVGAMQMSVPPGIVQDTMSALRRKYGDLLLLRKRFVTLERGYVLRSHSRRQRRSRKTGEPLSYPALVMVMRFT